MSAPPIHLSPRLAPPMFGGDCGCHNLPMKRDEINTVVC